MLGEAIRPQAAEPAVSHRIAGRRPTPRQMIRSRLMGLLAVVLCLVTLSAVPIWRLCWYYPLYVATDFLPVRDINGHRQSSWHWIDGKEIRIYTRPGLTERQADAVRAGVQAMVDEVPLAFTVRLIPMSNELQQAYRQSLITRHHQTLISFNQLAARVITLRQGDPHADIFVIDEPIDECYWARGMTSFTHGLAVLERKNVDLHLAKHETCHLLGYHYHDSLPLYIFGYREGAIPWQRKTLMLLYGGNDHLSDRASDALRYFWRGMERRSGKRFMKR